MKKTIIIITGIILILSGTVTIISFANKAKERKEQEQKETLLRTQYDICMIQADDLYDSNWSHGCTTSGKPEDCTTLPRYIAEKLNKELLESRETCLSTYRTMSLIELN